MPRWYVDERFRLRRALQASIHAVGFQAFCGPCREWFGSSTRAWGFHACFCQNCLRPAIWALTRASGFHVRFGGCHQHRQLGAARWQAHALEAGARAPTGCRREALVRDGISSFSLPFSLPFSRPFSRPFTQPIASYTRPLALNLAAPSCTRCALAALL